MKFSIAFILVVLSFRLDAQNTKLSFGWASTALTNTSSTIVNTCGPDVKLTLNSELQHKLYSGANFPTTSVSIGANGSIAMGNSNLLSNLNFTFSTPVTNVRIKILDLDNDGGNTSSLDPEEYLSSFSLPPTSVSLGLSINGTNVEPTGEGRSGWINWTMAVGISSLSFTYNRFDNRYGILLDSIAFDCTLDCCPVFRATKDSSSCSIKWVRQQDLCTDTIRAISITLDNGNFGPGGITSTCTGLVFSPVGYIGNNTVNITKVCLIPFAGNINANITAKDCTKPVLAIFKITMASGKVCSSEEILKCACPPNPLCCAKVQSLFTVCEPMHDLLHGKFTITNLDPSSPICKVKISASPSPSFSNSGLMIDGTTYSGSFWNPMMIPAAGTISAMNSIMFSLATDISYTGNITITVMKCDSTVCTFTVKWKGKAGPTSTIRPVQIPLQIETGYGLSAYQFQLKGSGNNPIAAKYCSIGMDTNDCPKIFAISGAMHSSDSFPTYLEPVELAQMGNNNAFFGLCCPRPLKQGESSGLFNLVLKVKKEKGKTTPLRITLFDDEGGIIYSDTLIVNNVTSDVSTSIIEIDDKDNPFNENLISVYPNPAANDLTIEYILGKAQMIKLELFNSSGMLVKELVNERKSIGLNQLLLDITNLTAGAYIIKMHSESDVSNVKFEVVK